MTTDVVCNMKVDETATDLFIEFEGRTYWFCSVGCKAEFKRHREEYSIKDQGPEPKWGPDREKV